MNIMKQITKGTALEGMFNPTSEPQQAVRLVDQQAAHIRILERQIQSLMTSLATLRESQDFQLPEVEITDVHHSGDPQLESWHAADPDIVAQACSQLIKDALEDGTLEELVSELECRQ